MAEYVPPFYSKLGSKVSDLFSKKYSFKNEIATKHRTDNGVTLETGATGGKGGINGTSKVTYSDSSWGEATVKVQSKNRTSTSGELKLKKLSKGLEIVAKADVSPKGSVQANYKQDYFSVQGSLSTDGDKSKIGAAGVIGFDGLNVGGEIQLDGVGEINDYNLAVEYGQDDFAVTLKTKDSGANITLGYFQHVSAITSLGASFQHNPDKNTRSLTFGLQHQLDAATTVKAKATSDGIVTSCVEHRLDNPSFLLGVSASFNALGTDPLVAQDLGVSFKFGDY